MTFAEWAAAGAIIGVKAFFAVFVFLMFVILILGLFAVIMSIFQVGSGNNDIHRN